MLQTKLKLDIIRQGVYVAFRGEYSPKMIDALLAGKWTGKNIGNEIDDDNYPCGLAEGSCKEYIYESSMGEEEVWVVVYFHSNGFCVRAPYDEAPKKFEDDLISALQRLHDGELV